MIASHCENALRNLSKKHIEQEARLGSFYKGEFRPGVGVKYFNDMKRTLQAWGKHMNVRNQTSIAIYFTGGLRAERFSSGHVDIIKKFKVAEDIDIDEKDHYSMRISTSKEEPVHNDMLKREIERFLKTKSLPKLFREGTLMKLKPGCTVKYGSQQHCVDKGFSQLIWRNENPLSLIDLDRNIVTIHDNKEEYRRKSDVKVI